MGLTPERSRKYRVAWVGGCVMYDTAKLRTVGGFRFWQQCSKSPNFGGFRGLKRWRTKQKNSSN
ncbi:hypothetical protein [Phormidesmis priestleyi]|uniref:hypothetical protein n=1 Tax=Phormidesmis priestleyi TaxID=268141 RepID=UPI001C633828|nr:hypothetical protein [Phormidesmis priestleyi]